MDDEDIDYSDIPPLGEKFFEQASIYVPASKRGTAVQLDQDVYTWFKNQSEEYQSLINLVLRKYMELRQESPSFK